EELGRTPDPDGALLRLKRLDSYGDRSLLPVVGYGDYLTDVLARPEKAHRDTEILRIAAADLSSEPTRAPFERTSSALADLADECVRRLLEHDGVAVMAMGKYGAQELNYASDIDVLFVGPDEATPAVRRLMQTMNGPPVIFRVDADLRPE